MKRNIKIWLTVGLFLILVSFGFFYKNNQNISLANKKTPESYLATLPSGNTPNTTSSQPSIVKPTNPSSIRVPILVYHSIRPYRINEPNSTKIYNIEPSNFAIQLQYLKDHGYTTINYDDLVNYFDGGTLPTKPVMINFDDGLENQYTNAFPILKEKQMTATFFLFSNAIGRKNYFTWEQVRELANAGMNIGGHSQSHPYLWKITDQKQLQKEVTNSKKIIEDNLGKPITVFAYPFGLYKPITTAAVKAAGYKAARTGYERATHTKEELFTLHSIQVSANFKKFVGVLENLK